MKYEQLVIETESYSTVFELPRENPVKISICLQSRGSHEKKLISKLHIVCAEENDIVTIIRPSGKFSIEPTEL